MRKTKTLICLAIIAFLGSYLGVSAAASLQNTINYYNIAPTQAFLAKDILFWQSSDDNAWYSTNLTSNVSASVESQIKETCKGLRGSTFVNSQGNFYCIDFKNKSIDHLDPLNSFKVIASYKLNLKADSFFKIIDDYIFFGENLHFEIFSTLTNKVTCTANLKSIEFGAAHFTAIENSLILSEIHIPEGHKFANYSCVTNSITNSFVAKERGTSTGIIALNSSTVFVNIFQDDYTFKILLPFTFNGNKVGKKLNLTLGQAPIDTLHYKVNDTHFVISYIDQQNFTSLGLFYVNANLEVVQVGYINLGLRFSDYANYDIWTPVTGKNTLILSIASNVTGHNSEDLSAYMEVDLGKFKAIRGAGYYPYMFPQVQLANGTILELSQIGYWIYNPGSSDIYFREMPSWTYYIDPLNTDVVWGLFTPAVAALANYPYPYLIKIEISTSTLTMIPLTSLPCTVQAQSVSMVVDIQSIVQNGIYFNITYRCTYNIYQNIINNLPVGKAIVDNKNSYDKSPILFSDFENQIVKAIYLADTKGVILSTYDMKKGTLINETKIMAHTTGITGIKINEDLAIITNSSKTLGNKTNVYIYSVSQNKFIRNYIIPGNNYAKIYPVGVNPSSLQIVNNFVVYDEDQGIFGCYNTLGIGSQLNTNHWTGKAFALNATTFGIKVSEVPVSRYNLYSVSLTEAEESDDFPFIDIIV